MTVLQLARMREKIDLQREKDPDRPVVHRLEEEYARRREALAAELGVSETEVNARVHEEIYGHRPGEEPRSDLIIGRALRWSLTVLVVLGLIAGLWWLYLSRPEEAAPTREIETAAPRTLDTTLLDPPPLPFTDVARSAGIDFVHDSGATGDKLLPETMGGGVTLFDYDGDSDADLLFVNGMSWDGGPGAATPVLYRNDSGPGGLRFTDVTAEAGLDVPLYGMAAVAADYDGDGDQDLFLTAVGPNRLLRNDSTAEGARFTDVTTAAGVAGAADGWSTCAVFFDADGDRDLDLFVCNYVQWSRDIDFRVDYRLTGIGRAYGPPANYQGAHSALYLQDGGTFRDVSAEAGVQVDNPATGLPAGKALGVAAVDADGDGDVDLLVANDTVGNFFFRNRTLGPGGEAGEPGRFVEEGTELGLAYDRMGAATGAMGVDAGYLRNDADMGYLIGNFANEMTSVYIAQGDTTLYADEAIASGLGAPSRTRLTFGILLTDADLDGRLDVVQTNGHLENEIAQVDPSQTFEQSAQLFWNAGPDAPRTFVAVADDELGDLTRPLVGRGSAAADLDGDGDEDLVMTQIEGPPLVLRNDQATGHHWLRVRLLGPPGEGNRDALGAWIEVTAGGVTQRRPVMPVKSYLSQSALPVTFGLGAATRVDSLVVVWPDGTREEREVTVIDQEIAVPR